MTPLAGGFAFEAGSGRISGPDGGFRVALSESESVVLAALLRHRGRLVSRDALRGLLYDAEPDAPLYPVEAVFVHHVRAKLRAAGVGEEIATCRGRGWVMDRRAG